MYRRIMVPVDGSPTSQCALDEALKIARMSRAQIELVHVVNDLEHLTGFECPDVVITQIRPAFMRAAQALLDRTLRQVEAEGVRGEPVLIESQGARVSTCLLNHVRTHRPDLIVLGTHGRRGVDRFFLGSDAEQVVRRSPVPVMLVRQPRPAASPDSLLFATATARP